MWRKIMIAAATVAFVGAMAAATAADARMGGFGGGFHGGGGFRGGGIGMLAGSSERGRSWERAPSLERVAWSERVPSSGRVGSRLHASIGSIGLTASRSRACRSSWAPASIARVGLGYRQRGAGSASGPAATTATVTSAALERT